jgi:hypothetical protein
MQELADDLRLVKETLRVLEEQVVLYRGELVDTRKEIAGYATQLRQLNLDAIVQRVSRKIITEFYEEVGKAVVKRVLTLVGIAAFIFGCWLLGTGRVKLP